MLLLVFDTETTHLLTEKTVNVCRIVQLSWILYDTDTNITEENDFILNSYSPITNSEIHGITTKMSQKGYDFSEIVDIFLDDLRKSDLIVGHNLQYDLNSVEIELGRLDRWDDIDYLFSKESFDTMKEAYKILKLKKFPKLVKLYKYFFGKDFDNAHNALFDVKATKECYLKLNFNC